MKRRDIQDAAVLCRGLGHAWDEYSNVTSYFTGPGWHFTVRCIRCATERHDLIDTRTGELDRRKYKYPDGYKEVERTDRADLRLQMRRLIRQHNNEKELYRVAS